MNKTHDAVLVGLGQIGFGEGEYAKRWNSHLGSLLLASWIGRIYVSDKQTELVERACRLASDVRPLSEMPNQIGNRRLILIDAAPQKGRLERVAKLSASYDFDLIFLEKPIDYSIFVDPVAYPWGRTFVHYPRAAFKSTAMLQAFVGEGFDFMRFRFNNGTNNTVSHFLNFLDVLGHSVSADKARLSGERTVSFGNVEVCHVVATHNIFEIDICAHGQTVFYHDFGRSIVCANRSWKLREIDQRFRRIYDHPSSVAAMPTLSSDAAQFKVLQTIRELIGDGV